MNKQRSKYSIGWFFRFKLYLDSRLPANDNNRPKETSAFIPSHKCDPNLPAQAGHRPPTTVCRHKRVLATGRPP